MATQLGLGKSIAVLAVVVGCFTVLWPKIFFPMLQAVLYGSSSDSDRFAVDSMRSASRERRSDPRIREDMGQARPSDSARENRRGRPFPPVSMRTPPRPVAKTGGTMNLVMPLYTIGIVVFFVYTILQLACKKSPEETRTQTHVFPMDCPCEEATRQKLASHQVPRAYGGRQDKLRGSPGLDASSCLRRGQRDQRDLEMEELRRRLANAEALVQELLLQGEDSSEVPVARSLFPAVGRSIGVLVKELTLQSQRQAGIERQQERCCSAGSPVHHTSGITGCAPGSPQVERANQSLRQRKVCGDLRPTCSCGAPLEGTAVQDLESDCHSDSWEGRDSEDDNAEHIPGSNDDKICAECH